MGSMPAASPSAMPMASAGPAASAKSIASPNPWRVAAFALAAVALVGIAVAARDRRPATVAVFAVASVAIVALAFFQARTPSSDGGMGTMGNASGSAAIPVTTVRISAERHGATIAAPANVQPYLVQNITARVPGVLTGLSAYAGDRVRAGEVVARLEEPELQSNAQAASAGAQAAQSELHTAENDAIATSAQVAAARERVRYWNAEIVRERALLAQGAVSTQEYQDERAQAASARSAYAAAQAKAAASQFGVQTAQAQAAQAEANAQSQNVTAGYVNLIAPDDAVVMKRLVDPGVYVMAGTPVLQVAVVNRLRVQAQIAQQDLAAVHTGTPIDVIIDDGQTLHGRVTSVSPVADPATHTAIVEAIVSNGAGIYQPGGYVRVRLHAAGAAIGGSSFSVPSAAIVGGARPAIWTDVRGMAHRVPVTVLSDDGISAQIRGPVRGGDRVVVAGASGLGEGQAIVETTP